MSGTPIGGKPRRLWPILNFIDPKQYSSEWDWINEWLETEEQTEIGREIENINVGRTLNFVFRQMNQEFITILHLVDVRVAYFNGDPDYTREVTLPQLDSA